MVVADVGAGSGYMTVRLAARVGPTGKVFAEDLQAALLGIIQSKTREQKLSNIETVQGTGLPRQHIIVFRSAHP